MSEPVVKQMPRQEERVSVPDYSNFYNENKIITEDEELTKARLYLSYVTGIVLKVGARLLGIEMPNKM